MKNLFLKALLGKWRFPTTKGQLNLEQVCSLSDDELDALYMNLSDSNTKSKGLIKRNGNSKISEQLKIVEEIFTTKRALAEKSRLESDNKLLREKLLIAADKKELEEITEGKSAKELRKEAKKLR